MIIIVHNAKSSDLDSDNVYPAEIDENGYTFVYGEEGRTYEVEIDF